MNTHSFDLSRFLNTLATTKRYWVTLTLAVIVGLNLFGLTLPRKYEASAQVRIHEPKMIETAGAIGAQVLNVRDRLDTIKEEMSSFKFLATVAQITNLDAGLDPAGPEYETRIKQMAKNLTLIVKGQDLFQVTYKANSPEEAYKVVDTIVEEYTKLSGASYEKGTTQVTSFIEMELKLASAELERAQKAVLEYNQKNINLIPEEQEANQRQLNELRVAHASTQQQMQGLENGLIFAKAKLASIPSEQTATETQMTDDVRRLTDQKRELEAKYALLIQDFYPTHWEVRDTTAAIKVLEERIKAAEQSKTEKVTKAPNPAYEGWQDKIRETELHLNTLRDQAKAQESKIAQLEKYLDKMPAVRLEQSKLKNAEQLAVQRVTDWTDKLAQAKLTEQMNRKGQGPSYEKMDPPRLPTNPVSPNRAKIGAVSGILGFGAGFALAFLLSILDTTLRSIEEARRVLQMPILGVVQRVVSATDEIRIRRRRRRRLLGASTGAALLVVLIVVGMAYYREPISRGLDSIRALLGQ